MIEQKKAPWVIGWELANGLFNKIECGTWDTCKAE